MRVLVVEDYDPLREAIIKALREATYTVVSAAEGAAGLKLATSGPLDLVILDLMLPGMDGLTLLREIRKQQIDTYVLILTARDTVDDRIAGLDAGADDYLPKPFEMKELLARVRALVRRQYGKKETKIAVGEVEIDTAGRHVYVAGEEIVLTAREYALLEYLAHRKGEVVSRDEISEHLYYDGRPTASNVIDVYMGYLRRKLESPERPKLLHTRRGQGYLFGVVD